MKLKQFLIDHRENLQLLYGIFLIILIPLLIASNTILIVGEYNRNTDVTLQLKMLAIGRTIYADLQENLDNETKIQEKIDKIYGRNSEFENIEVLVPETKTQTDEQGNSKTGNEGYKIIASSDKNEVGKFLTFYFYRNAWDQPDNDALVTNSLRLATTEDGSTVAASEDMGRFWLVAMPMQDTNGNKKAILSMRISSKVVDDITDSSRDKSLGILFVTVIITIMFLSITVRLWDYVVLYKKIKEVDQMKDEFISIASHELRTPLTAIKGYTSLIIDGTFGKFESKDLNQSLGRIMTSTKRLEELVEDLLDVSRLEQGRLSFEKTSFQTEPVVEEIVSQLSITAQEKNLELIHKKPEEPLPPIYADQDRLKQVLVNLIGNAIKYTEKGSVTVSTEAKDGKLQIKVTDTGIGISPEGQKRLFQKFYRVKTDKTESIQGTGLGLWITKQIIETMGGNIYLESIEGQGTQVIVVLNLATEKR